MRKEQRITVDVDWTRVPAGLTQVELTVNGPNKAKVVVHVPVHAPAGLHAETLRGHVETGGVVAMEAEHYSRASAPAGSGQATLGRRKAPTLRRRPGDRIAA